MASKCCKNCALFLSGPNICQVFKRKINQINETICPEYTREIYQCELCGSQIIKPQILIDEHVCCTICEKCAQITNTCYTCLYSQHCDFETNPSPMPKAIQKSIRQGNQTIVATIKNPDRVEITCKKNCKCYIEGIGCCKESETCGNYQINIKEKIQQE